MPSQALRFSSGATRPTTDSNSGRPQPLAAKPARKPTLNIMPSAVVDCAMRVRPMVYRVPATTMTRIGPHLSAMAAANGAESPITRLWVATASENTSRPQPMSMLIGRRYSPKLWRVP